MLEVYFNTAAWILLTCLCLGELWTLMACWNLTFPELSSQNTDIIFFSFLLRNWIESYVFPGYIIFPCNLQLFVTSLWIDSHSNTKSLHGNIGRDQANKSCQALKGPVLAQHPDTQRGQRTWGSFYEVQRYFFSKKYLSKYLSKKYLWSTVLHLWHCHHILTSVA